VRPAANVRGLIVRRGILVALLLSACSLVVAQTYPSRPVTLLTPVPPGGAVDRITRAWMACAQERGGQPLVLQHRPGGNGVVAMSALRQLPADGHTLLVVGMSQATIVPFIHRKQPFDPLVDLHGTAVFASSPYLLVASAQSGIRSVADLQARARNHAGGIDIGIPNVATPAHLLSAALAQRLAIPATVVPTGGEAAGVTALLAGQIPAMVFVPGTVAPHIASGKLVPLLAFTQARLPDHPAVPTVVEATGDASLARLGWLGIAARAGTPPAVLDAVESWTRDCMEVPAFRDALSAALVTPTFVPQADMASLIRRDIAFWSPWIARLDLVQSD
jgi:tripartite-type tricarboxylate transporter receptor subunit TctC